VDVLVLASYTMIVLDISIINTALPKIHHALGFSSAALSWVRNAYLLTFGGLLLLGARASPTRGEQPRHQLVRSDRAAGSSPC
jgi:MFS family permease